jgi:hypothetical protein
MARPSSSQSIQKLAAAGLHEMSEGIEARRNQ